MLTPKGVLRLDVTTDNPAVQVYTGYWLDTPRKVVHGGPDVNYTKWSAVAIEQEGYIDAINTPEWGVDQICECAYGFGFEMRSVCSPGRDSQIIRGRTTSGSRCTSSPPSREAGFAGVWDVR